jgi:hypothetical protein
VSDVGEDQLLRRDPVGEARRDDGPGGRPDIKIEVVDVDVRPHRIHRIKDAEVIGGTGYAAAPEDQGRLSAVGRCRARLPTLQRFRGEVDDRTHAWRLSRRGPASREPGCAVIMSFPGG